MPASPSRHRQSDLAAIPQETAHPSENKEKLPGLFSESSSEEPAPFFQNTITTSSCIPTPIAPTAPGENHIKVFDRGIDRGPFQSSFITCPNTDRSSLIHARVSQPQGFLQSSKWEHQWKNIRASLDLYRTGSLQDPLSPIVCIQERFVVPIDTLSPGPYWIEVSILLDQFRFLIHANIS